MIGMALAAVLLCVNLTSCDKDDDDSKEIYTTNNGGNAGKEDNDSNGDIEIIGKKLIKEERYVYYPYTGSWEKRNSTEFKYDADGYLIESCDKEWYHDWEEDLVKYIWNSDRSSFTRNWDGEYAKFTLNKGKINKAQFSEDGETWECYGMYNKEYIKECGYVEDGSNEPMLIFTWNNNGQLSKLDYWHSYTRSFSYDGKTCIGFFPAVNNFWGEDFSDYLFIMAQPELFGLRTTQLPSKMTDTYSNSTTTFEYDFDAEGYVIRCIETGEYTSPRYHEYTWE